MIKVLYSVKFFEVEFLEDIYMRFEAPLSPIKWCLTIGLCVRLSVDTITIQTRLEFFSKYVSCEYFVKPSFLENIGYSALNSNLLKKGTKDFDNFNILQCLIRPFKAVLSTLYSTFCRSVQNFGMQDHNVLILSQAHLPHRGYFMGGKYAQQKFGHECSLYFCCEGCIYI